MKKLISILISEIVFILPLVYLLSIFLTGEKGLMIFTFSTLVLIFFIKFKKSHSRRSCSIFILAFVIIVTSFNSYVWFGFILLTISMIAYKLLEWIGDKTEAFLKEKNQPPALSSLGKLITWIFILMGFIFLILLFIVYFVQSYPDNLFSIVIKNSTSYVFSWVYVIILTILLTIFIVDFLVKVFLLEENLRNRQLTQRSEVFIVFMKLLVVVIFADMNYATLYLIFSGINTVEFDSSGNILLLYFRYLQAFYYAFCLHFAVPMPTTKFFVDLDMAVKSKEYLYIIQFFHYSVNKIIDIVVLVDIGSRIILAIKAKKDTEG